MRRSLELSYEAKRFMRGFAELLVLAVAAFGFLFLGLSF